MSMVADCYARRSQRDGHGGRSRDRARPELQQCAADIQAQEYTQSAMSIAERHAAERDAALVRRSTERCWRRSTAKELDREALQADRR